MFAALLKSSVVTAASIITDIILLTQNVAASRSTTADHVIGRYRASKPAGSPNNQTAIQTTSHGENVPIPLFIQLACYAFFRASDCLPLKLLPR